MSDLAPFVAAALRDKALADLQEEADKLREQLKCSRAVEITGRDGIPVYARGQFGINGTYGDNPNLWTVKLVDELQQCTVSGLKQVEIRLGGSCITTFREDSNGSFQGYLDEDEDDGENCKVVHFYFQTSHALWLSVVVNGWPKESWESAIEQGVDIDDMLRYLIEDDSTRTARFRDVSFSCKSVSGVIRSLTLGKSVVDDAEERRKRHAFDGKVMNLMRDEGHEDVRIGIGDMLDALNMLGLSEFRDGERGEADYILVRRLARLQLSHGERFLDVVRDTLPLNAEVGDGDERGAEEG